MSDFWLILLMAILTVCAMNASGEIADDLSEQGKESWLWRMLAAVLLPLGASFIALAFISLAEAL